jgi:hypothetical protein
MPHIKTLFRSPPLSTPTINYYDWLLGRPELDSWPDFTLHIDAVTGERRQARAVLERFEQAATALAMSTRDGGHGLVSGRQGVLVGILSENCLVRAINPPFLWFICAAYTTMELGQRNTQFLCLPFSSWPCRWRSFLRSPLFKKLWNF